MECGKPGAKNRWNQFANCDGNEKQGTQCHRQLARLSGIVKCRNKPAIIFGSKHCKVIGHNAPTSRLRKHVQVPMTPAQLAQDKKGDPTAGGYDNNSGDSRYQ